MVAEARGAGEAEVLAAYAEGFEAMGALARASHPALYERGWHPTAVCGPLGAAVASARIMGLGTERRRTAAALALLAGSGLQAAFGSDAKALQVGRAAASGVHAALLSEAGARAPLDEVVRGFESAYGASWADPDTGAPCIELNWIKAWPCCLQTHAPIEAAAGLRGHGARAAHVAVHPVSLRAAAVGIPADGLQAKFSIPYLVALALLEGPPGVESFRSLSEDALALAERIEVVGDPELAESEAVVTAGGAEARVAAALGSPGRPLPPDLVAAKRRSLGAFPEGAAVGLPAALAAAG